MAFQCRSIQGPTQELHAFSPLELFSNVFTTPLLGLIKNNFILMAFCAVETLPMREPKKRTRLLDEKSTFNVSLSFESL